MYVLRAGLGQTGDSSVDLSTLYPFAGAPSSPDVFTCPDGSPVPASGVCSGGSSSGITSWLNDNSGKIAIGAGIFAALAIFAGGRR